MKCEVVAVGTELLLGQIVDTNSSWIGEQLALAGIDSHFQTKVGDNLDRMIAAFEQALDRSDAVIVCGGLGPTPDDITREAIAAVMGVGLRRDEAVVERIRAMFYRRDRQMPANNLQQADVPVGARVMDVQPGTAPGLICPVRRGRGSGDPANTAAPDAGKVIYAVPGVPWEMQKMVSECVLPDLQARAGERHVIRSRILRTWGHSESGLAELLDPEMRRLDSTGEATIAFLASGMEGLKVRITAKAADDETALSVLSGVEARARAVIGDAVFGADDDTMESVVVDLMQSQGLTLGLAESVTGGLIAARLTDVPGASRVLRGAVVPYDREIKTGVLGAPDVNAVSSEMALAMAEGACRVLGTDVGLATTGAAGPDAHEGAEAGTVWIGLHLDGEGEATRVRFNMARTMVRQLGTITALNLLRTRLLSRGG
ncbi:MAG: competence/damage-inducible protein A [Acidimicrobiaceae bacterium]|nr:competence/damage-inducible protein A [Acidimicrobiaceae bacterium]MYL03078.1 competence/damage-inducible protein A [Acidimicrobiaceae bacterium]